MPLRTKHQLPHTQTNMNNAFHNILVSLLFVATTLQAKAQSQDISNLNPPACINLLADTIIFNGADWSDLFERLRTLENPSDQTPSVISILHLGDSHVQAGFFTAAFRKPLQERWGNAGRGLIIPLRLTHSNEPTDYSITSPQQWKYSRCVGNKYFSRNIGLSGIAVYPSTQDIDLTFKTLSKTDDCNGFNTLRLFHSRYKRFPLLQPTDTLINLNIAQPSDEETLYSWDKQSTTCSVRLKGTHQQSNDSIAIYGASLENGHDGIIVHAIGNNSAYFDCYNNIPEFASKITALTPQLIIISLGTNESVAPNTTHASLYNQIDALVSSIQKKLPQAIILLTTPGDNKIRRRRRNKNRRRTYYVENPRLPSVVETIKDYGKEHHIAVWDWYTIAGGKNSCQSWVSTHNMARDHIHYTREGYELQGFLLYNSISAAYEQYTQHNH